MKLIYSTPKVYALTDPELITNYVAAVNSDPARYFTDEKGVFNALKYREFQLNLEPDANGNFQPTEEKQFFSVKPENLDWEGEITIRVESMVEQSRPLERQQKLELSNILLPLIPQMAANPVILMAYLKPVKQLLKLYDEDPTEWLPEQWLQEQVLPAPGVVGLPGSPEAQTAEQIAPGMEAPQSEFNMMQSQSQQI